MPAPPFQVYDGYDLGREAHWCIRCEDWIPFNVANGSRMVGTLPMAIDWHVYDHIQTYFQLKRIDERVPTG